MRDLLIFLVVCSLIWGCGSQVELSGKSQPGRIHLRPYQERPGQASTLPAHIVLKKKRFEEPSGNRALDGEEEGALVLQVRNDGLGPGKVAVRLTPLSDMEHVHFSRYVEAGLVGVQESRTIRVPIQAGQDVADGQRQMRVEVIEEYKRGTIPFTVNFKTLSLVTPEFRVIVRDYDDGRGFFEGNTPDGVIKAGEMVKVVANVQNIGGEAEGVEVEVEIKEGRDDVGFYRSIETGGSVDNRFVLGRMAPGENRDVQFYFYTTPVFTDPEVKLALKVGEGTLRHRGDAGF